jgi:hypothetical protein
MKLRLSDPGYIFFRASCHLIYPRGTPALKKGVAKTMLPISGHEKVTHH